MSTTISEADLRRMLDAVSPDAEDSPGAEMPKEVLTALSDLIPCTSVSYYEYHPESVELRAMQVVEWRSFPPDTSESDALFAEAYWDCVACSNPAVSGNVVTRWRDFYSDRVFNQLRMSDYMRAMEFWHDLLLCLPSRPGRERRLLFTRDRADVPFSERDRMVLTLLRPHLTVIRDRVEAKMECTPDLTPRQVELLRLVASGWSNRQISRRLGLADGTVRKHLENTYARLDVHSRTEAVARAAPLLETL
jgi:DNA-binding CsgD family transcriptional regulator